MSPSPEPERPLVSFTPPETPDGVVQTPAPKIVSHLRPNNNAWSSPAFLKLKELPGVSVLGKTSDSFWDNDDAWEQGHPAKRAKFGRSSGQWRFVERTPSPENEASLEQDSAIIFDGENFTEELTTYGHSMHPGNTLDVENEDKSAEIETDQDEISYRPNNTTTVPGDVKISTEGAIREQTPSGDAAGLVDRERDSSVETRSLHDLPNSGSASSASFAISLQQSSQDDRSMADAQARSSSFADMVSSPELKSSPPLPPEEMGVFKQKSAALHVDVQGATPYIDGLSDDRIEAPGTPRLQPLPSPGLDIVSPLDTRSQTQKAHFERQQSTYDFLHGSSRSTVKDSSQQYLQNRTDHDHLQSKQQTVQTDSELSSSSFAVQHGGRELSSSTGEKGKPVVEKSTSVGEPPNDSSRDLDGFPTKDADAVFVKETAEQASEGLAIRPSAMNLSQENEHRTNNLSGDRVQLETGVVVPSQTSKEDVEVTQDIDQAASGYHALSYNVASISREEDTQEQPEEGNADASDSKPDPERQETLFEQMITYFDTPSEDSTFVPVPRAQEIGVRPEEDQYASAHQNATDNDYIDPSLRDDQTNYPGSFAANAQAPIDHSQPQPIGLSRIQQSNSEQHVMKVDEVPSSLPGEICDLRGRNIQDTYRDEEELLHSSMTEEIKKPIVTEITELVDPDEPDSSSVTGGLGKLPLALAEAGDTGGQPSVPREQRGAFITGMQKVLSNPTVEMSQDCVAESYNQNLDRFSQAQELSEEEETQPQYTMPSSSPPLNLERARPLTRAQFKLRAPTTDAVFRQDEDHLESPVFTKDFAAQYLHTPEASQQAREELVLPVATLEPYEDPHLLTPRLTQKSTSDLNQISQSQEYVTAPGEADPHEDIQADKIISGALNSQEFQPTEDIKTSLELGTEDSQLDPLSQQLSSSPPPIVIQPKTDGTANLHKSRASTKPLTGFRTPLSYYVPLPLLHQHYKNRIDTVAICVVSTKITKVNRGRKDYMQTLYLTDPSSLPNTTPITTAELYRPFNRALPSPAPGEVVLLRECEVAGRVNDIKLKSTSTSAWAVWRRGDNNDDGLEMEVKGPPVEVGPEERGFIRELQAWWNSIDGEIKVKMEAAIPSSAEGKEKGVETGRGGSRGNWEGPQPHGRLGGTKLKREEFTNNEKSNTKPVEAMDKVKYRQKEAPEPLRSRPRKAVSTTQQSADEDEGQDKSDSQSVEKSPRQMQKRTTKPTRIDPPKAAPRSKGADTQHENTSLSPLRSSARSLKVKSSPRQSPKRDHRVHTLRSGMKYSDEVDAPRPRSRGKGSRNEVTPVHELRDGTTWRDTDV